MRAQACPSDANRFPLLVFLLGGTLLIGPARAWAIGNVTFLQMTADRCEESGACEWKLSCGVGENPQETELLNGASARTKYSVKIGRSLDIQEFPTKVHCTAWEDDGWFGPKWQQVASGSVDVPAGGNFRLSLGDNKQGSVLVQMAIDSLEIGIAPPPPPAAETAGKKPAKTAGKAAAKPAPPLQFLGVFNPQAEGHAVAIGLEWKPFKAMVDKLAGLGIQIDDVETFEQDGKRRWSGIFRNSSDQVQLLTDQDGKKFVDSWKKLTGGKMRLTDVEIYESAGKNLYAGIFRDLGEGHNLWLGLPRKDFATKVKDLADLKGQRLADFEVYRSGGALVYDGTFRAVTRDVQLWTALSQAAIQSKAAGLRGKEWELQEVVTYKDGKDRLFDALVRAGAPGGDLIMAPDVNAFATRWREQAVKGQRLVSFDAYRE